MPKGYLRVYYSVMITIHVQYIVFLAIASSNVVHYG